MSTKQVPLQKSPYWKRRKLEDPPRTKYDYQRLNKRAQSDIEYFKETIYKFVHSQEAFDYLNLFKVHSLAYPDLVPDLEDPYDRGQKKRFVGSTRSRLLEKNYIKFAPTLEVATHIIFNIWEGIGCLAPTFYMLRLAQDLKEFADNMDLKKNIEKFFGMMRTLSQNVLI